MQVRYQSSPNEVRQMTTEQLRNNFLVENLIVADEANFVYSHHDRMIFGGVVPKSKSLELLTYDQLKADYFLERREMGIINVGGNGSIITGDKIFNLHNLDCLYLGKGTKNVLFASDDATRPAQFYLLSAQAHHDYPNKLLKKEEASPTVMGSVETANLRTIYKYIHAEGLKSCQLVMGLTVLEVGNVWNTMPAHTHDGHMEAYFYFDVAALHRVLHLMGEPQETRHLVVANHQAVISPPWSIHSGCGTTNYRFIWGMAGENYTYSDMDAVAISALK